VTKLIGYARSSTRQQSTDRQEVDILAALLRLGWVSAGEQRMS
jgi:DNA invertase Pin-like site-specific DNA recombinase